MSIRINIIGKSNGVGLARDLHLLSGALQQTGHEVSVTVIDGKEAKRRRSALAQLRTRIVMTLRRWRRSSSNRNRPDINLMMEHVWLQYLDDARINVVVPNPEWFDRHDRRFLRNVDVVWAKTKYTEQLFKALRSTTRYIGFDSYDRFDSAIVKKRTYFHLAGKSTMKGTDRLLAVWRKHPEWPRLIVVQHNDVSYAGSERGNIELQIGYLTDEQLKTLQNESAFHICTSLTEGWGHYIVEALSVGAVTITVDARPMNELVTAERGVLVPYRATGQQRLATTYEFDQIAFESAVERTIAMSDEECARIGANARLWFANNKCGFADRLGSAVRAAAI